MIRTPTILLMIEIYKCEIRKEIATRELLVKRLPNIDVKKSIDKCWDSCSIGLDYFHNGKHVNEPGFTLSSSTRNFIHNICLEENIIKVEVVE